MFSFLRYILPDQLPSRAFALNTAELTQQFFDPGFWKYVFESDLDNLCDEFANNKDGQVFVDFFEDEISTLGTTNTLLPTVFLENLNAIIYSYKDQVAQESLDNLIEIRNRVTEHLQLNPNEAAAAWQTEFVIFLKSSDTKVASAAFFSAANLYQYVFTKDFFLKVLLNFKRFLVTNNFINENAIREIFLADLEAYIENANLLPADAFGINAALVKPSVDNQNSSDEVLNYHNKISEKNRFKEYLSLWYKSSDLFLSVFAILPLLINQVTAEKTNNELVRSEPVSNNHDASTQNELMIAGAFSRSALSTSDEIPCFVTNDFEWSSSENGKNDLTMASSNENDGTSSTLLQDSVKPTSVDTSNLTPLMKYVIAGHIPGIMYLAPNADLIKRNFDNEDVFDVAHKVDNIYIRPFIKSILVQALNEQIEIASQIRDPEKWVDLIRRYKVLVQQNYLELPDDEIVKIDPGIYAQEALVLLELNRIEEAFYLFKKHSHEISIEEQSTFINALFSHDLKLLEGLEKSNHQQSNALKSISKKQQSNSAEEKNDFTNVLLFLPVAMIAPYLIYLSRQVPNKLFKSKTIDAFKAHTYSFEVDEKTFNIRVTNIGKIRIRAVILFGVSLVELSLIDGAKLRFINRGNFAQQVDRVKPQINFYLANHLEFFIQAFKYLVNNISQLNLSAKNFDLEYDFSSKLFILSLSKLTAKQILNKPLILPFIACYFSQLYEVTQNSDRVTIDLNKLRSLDDQYFSQPDRVSTAIEFILNMISLFDRALLKYKTIHFSIVNDNFQVELKGFTFNHSLSDEMMFAIKPFCNESSSLFITFENHLAIYNVLESVIESNKNKLEEHEGCHQKTLPKTEEKQIHARPAQIKSKHKTNEQDEKKLAVKTARSEVREKKRVEKTKGTKNVVSLPFFNPIRIKFETKMSTAYELARAKAHVFLPAHGRQPEIKLGKPFKDFLADEKKALFLYGFFVGEQKAKSIDSKPLMPRAVVPLTKYVNNDNEESLEKSIKLHVESIVAPQNKNDAAANQFYLLGHMIRLFEFLSRLLNLRSQPNLAKQLYRSRNHLLYSHNDFESCLPLLVSILTFYENAVIEFLNNRNAQLNSFVVTIASHLSQKEKPNLYYAASKLIDIYGQLHAFKKADKNNDESFWQIVGVTMLFRRYLTLIFDYCLDHKLFYETMFSKKSKALIKHTWFVRNQATHRREAISPYRVFKLAEQLVDCARLKDELQNLVNLALNHVEASNSLAIYFKKII